MEIGRCLQYREIIMKIRISTLNRVVQKCFVTADGWRKLPLLHEQFDLRGAEGGRVGDCGRGARVHASA